MNSRWLQGLNPEQQQAASHNNGPLLILAGAGSGKTTVLVHRTGRMIDEQVTKPQNILVLTFTNKAAKELTQRVQDKIGASAKKVWAGTFHSFGLSILKKYYKQANLPKRFGIIDQADSLGIVKDLLKTTKSSTKDDFDPAKLLEMINKVREGWLDMIETPDYVDMCQALTPKYIERLKSLGVVDFDALLLKPLELFQKHPEILDYYHKKFTHVMVDEFQDTNHNQMKLIDAITKKTRNLTVVGDDDQSIYGWRGAQIEHILGFNDQYKNCKTIYLTRNYRSKSTILDLANHVIAKNNTRHAKELKAVKTDDTGTKPEVFVYDNDVEESQGIIKQINHFKAKGYAFDDLCILYRSNSQGGMLEAYLRNEDMPYNITGGQGFFDRKEIKDILAYLTCLYRPNEIAFRRILNTPSRGIGDKTIETIEQHAKSQNISFFQASKGFDQLDIQKRSKAPLEKLHQNLQSYRNILLHGTKNTGDTLIQWMKEIGYEQYIHESFKDRHTASKRWDMILTFANVLNSFIEQAGRSEETILSFIEAMSLGNVETDTVQRPEIQLMTLHRAKGLEFPVVMILGMEEDIIPHRNLGSDISEERRLFYVGITRAKEHLLMTRTEKRKKRGRLIPSVPSRFLCDIPDELITEFPNGFRPMEASKRQAMIDALYKKLNS